MKLALAFALLVGCSINHRSGEYACTLETDCTSPRTCVQGFCIVPDGVPIDAPTTTQSDSSNPPPIDAKMNPPPDAPDMTVCPAQCTTCDLDQMTCRIECGTANANCAAEVVCPTGFSCLIGCNTANACKNGVDCTNATGCTIDCGGSGSCHNVECGDGPCNVTCSGSGSCKGVACGESCACDVSCPTVSTGSGGQSCQNVTCGGIACNDGLGCSSQNFDCNTCN